MRAYRTFLPALAAVVIFMAGCSSPLSGPEAPIIEAYVHERPAWSPDGSTIAFSVLNDTSGIYLVDTSGANLRKIKSGEGIGVAWSPDSKWLVFSAMTLLYKMKVNGDSLQTVGDGFLGIRPSWSHDGSSIAYSNSGLYVYSVTTGSNVMLLPYGNFASWKSDDSDIVYMVSSSAGVDAASYEFRSLHLSTNQESSLFTFFSSSDCGFSSINPAGNAMVFSLRSFSGTSPAVIVRLDLTTLAATKLTTDGGDYPAWSPDGQKIVYTRTAAGDGGLWIMNADGSGKRRLTQP